MWEPPFLKLRVTWALEVEEWAEEEEEEWAEEWAPEAEEWAPEVEEWAEEWAEEVEEWVEEWALAVPVAEAAPTGWGPTVQAVLVVASEAAHMVGGARVVVECPVLEAFTETHFLQDLVEIISPFFPEGTIGIAMETMGHFKSFKKES